MLDRHLEDALGLSNCFLFVRPNAKIPQRCGEGPKKAETHGTQMPARHHRPMQGQRVSEVAAEGSLV